jgi:hypothetical protein
MQDQEEDVPPRCRKWNYHAMGEEGLASVPPGRMTGAEFRSVHKRLCVQVPEAGG